jgi:2,4-dichlorophenol 6-monooxygenase
MSDTEVDVPVLIVGAGPAGLTASLALSRYGVDHLLVERHSGTAHTPRAHIVNQRSVEILRQLGIEERFHAAATPQAMMRNNIWCTSLTGREVARSETWGTGPLRSAEYAAASPVPMANCPQTVFEPLLLDAAREAGSDIRFDHVFEDARADDDGVTSTVLDRRSGERITVRSAYLLGADGARSQVLDVAGLEIEGPAGLSQAVNVWFRADLSRYLEHRPGVLVWNVMPGPLPPLRLGALICHRPFTEFVLAFTCDTAVEELGEADLVRRVRLLVGDDDLDVEIKGVAGWQVNAQVAPRYAAGRILCMGDAVHRHPPTNGLGLNMSVADAFNVAWKIAAVLGGRAGSGLLATYSDERQPVGVAGVQRAITSLHDMAGVDAALGLTPGQSEEEGWASLARLDEPGAAGEEMRRALREAVARTDYQFNAHGLELGYRYSSRAIVTDGTPEAAAQRDPLLHYTPTTRPGARVPHARLERDRVPISSLDLVQGLEFVLLTGVGGERWTAAAAEASARTGVPVTVHLIGGDSLRDPYGEWAARREVGPSGAVLVRPDQHVAWRTVAMTAGSADHLTAALTQIMDLAGGAVQAKTRLEGASPSAEETACTV